MTTLQEQFEKDFPDISVRRERFSGKHRNSSFTNYDLDLRKYVNIGVVEFNWYKITSINLSECKKLTRLDLSNNDLISVDFFKDLPNPEKLEYLAICNNNIQPTDISIFSKFVNLRFLEIGTMKTSLEEGKHNKFYGSLKSIKTLTKLEAISIETTDVDSGLEYLSASLKKGYGSIKCSPNDTNAKCKAIWDQLRTFKYDLEAWRLANFDKVIRILDEDKNKLEKNLNHQLSWKNKIKHAAIGSLLVLGSQKTYYYYNQGESNLTQSVLNYHNHTWLENIYLNVPLNEPEYKNLTHLLNLPQLYQAQKVNDILFSDSTDDLDWENELTRLKISDLTIQIPNKKSELAQLITETKLNKAENYLLEQLLAENLNSEKLTELKEILSDHGKTIEFILNKHQELRNLEKHLEWLQKNQLEAKIEI